MASQPFFHHSVVFTDSPTTQPAMAPAKLSDLNTPEDTLTAFSNTVLQI
jgi:hypothetical protein